MALSLVGSIPYGFKRNESVTNAKDKDAIIPDDVERNIIAICRRLKGQGLALRKIGAELTKQGFTPRGGKAWHPDTIKRIIENNLTKENK
jgi:hypothetical protein